MLEILVIIAVVKAFTRKAGEKISTKPFGALLALPVTMSLSCWPVWLFCPIWL